MLVTISKMVHFVKKKKQLATKFAFQMPLSTDLKQLHYEIISLFSYKNNAINANLERSLTKMT